MAGIDEQVAIMGDWVPPSPSPRTFFSSMLADHEIASKSFMDSPKDYQNVDLFLGSQHHQMVSRISDNENHFRNMMTSGGDQLNEINNFCEDRKRNSRGGLVERIAARAGFNAPRLNTESFRSADSDVRLTIPPGLSPTSLLDSPVFLSNSLAQPSPTTGKFPFVQNSNTKMSKLIAGTADRSKDNHFVDFNAESFSFKPVAESGSSFFTSAATKITPTVSQSFSNIEASIQSEKSLQCQTEDPRNFTTIGGSRECSPLHDETKHDDEGGQRGMGDSVVSGGGAPSEDVYNWRKYGQKQVKGSEYPRSYYKCTHPQCEVKKKVERSHEGHITEIIYKGAHNHPKPLPNRRPGIGPGNPFGDTQLDVQGSDLVWASTQNANAVGTSDWRNENLEVTSNALVAQNGSYNNESGDAVDVSSTFSNGEDEDDRETHGSVSLGNDGEGDESESKRRKIEAYATEMSGATRAIREPRVVVQTTSEVDILDDGYRWRKYGQKVVKGNPNPRSYYKCTNAGCTVRKHVERASHDLKAVITTYEGKHNHDVPAARNSSHVNSTASNSLAHQTAIQSHVHRPDPAQFHNNMARFERPGSIGSFNLPPHGFSFGMNQPGLANLTMAGLGTSQGSGGQYLGQQHQMNNMVFMVPKNELKMEPVLESGLNVSNSSSVYQQIMGRLPLGPPM